MISQRATTSEKAKAWDALMAHSGSVDDAIADAHDLLTELVVARERKGHGSRKPRQSAAMKRFLAEKFPTHCGTSPETEYFKAIKATFPGHLPGPDVDVTLEHNGNIIHANDPKGIQTARDYVKGLSL